MKCAHKSCDRNRVAGGSRCPVHQPFTRSRKRETLETGAGEGDGLCSSCNERRGWSHGLCKQCLGAA